MNYYNSETLLEQLQEIEKLKEKNSALVAQVEDLKARIGAFSINIERNEKIGASVKEEIAKLFIGVGENHLRQVRADAGRAGYLACAEEYGLANTYATTVGVTRNANAYHASILAGNE